MNITDKARLLQTSILTSLMISVAGAAYAQDAATQEEELEVIPEATQPVETDVESDRDEVVVTGSRLKRDTFSSISPLQVIDTEIAAEKGLFNPVEILQSSSTAGGQQIDSTFQGFVLDNGPGSETIDLRGLGANRTLVLVNGRRLAPAGVEGAPTQPSINLIPRTMVDRYDILTDGASSIYGSDAVAGVININLKNEFDGLEVDIFADTPEQGAGQDYTMGASYGVSNDRGFIGGAIEYRYQDPWTTADRDFLSGCTTNLEETENGDIRTVDITDEYVANQLGLNITTSGCIPDRLVQRIQEFGSDVTGFTNYGSIYYQPGISNSNIPGFSENSLFGVPVDGDGDGNVDVSVFDFSPNGQQAGVRTIVNEQKQTSLFLTGEYTFEGSSNITPYFELSYSQNKIFSQSGQGQLFPFVPANNPFNPCNTNQPNGVDCGLAFDDLLLNNQNYRDAFAAYYSSSDPFLGDSTCASTVGCTPENFGLLSGPVGPVRVRPIIGVRGDRNINDVKIEQNRIVGGVRGDLPFINFGSVKDFSFDVYGSHSYSNGESSRSGIREDKLNFALGIDPNTGAPLSAPCTPNADSNISAAFAAGCVPVNLFAPSLLNQAIGDFASPAERDYVFDSRDFNTYYAQTVVDGIIQGDLFTLPGGDVSLLLGAQYRLDEINSEPDDIARDGLFFGFFADGGARGERATKEVYGEIAIPLGLGKTFLRQFDVNLAGRLTDDEFYGTNETYSIKAGWRPIDSLFIKGTYGTSFRAPNLRELFLGGQTGFTNVADPCAVPTEAFDRLNGYNASNDTRSDTVLANCVAQGLDPTSFLGGQFTTYSVEVNTGGTTDLDPETSDSFTVGASFDQPFTDFFDLEIGATYYEIDIQSTVLSPSTGFILSDCYNQPNLTSAFCSRITRDPNDPANPGVISFLDAGFINRDQETARGIDFSADFEKRDISVFNRNFDFSATARVNRLLERKTADLINDVRLEEEFKGEFGYSKWRGQATANISYDKFRASWTTIFQSGVSLDEEDKNQADFSNFLEGGNVVTCSGPGNGDVNCRPVADAGSYQVHNASVSYREDDWSLIVGVNNVLDKSPALVDSFEPITSISNVPLGNGYDLEGREYFIRVSKSFR